MKPGIFIQVTAGKNYKGLDSVIFKKGRDLTFIEILVNRLRKVEGASGIYLLFADNDKNRPAISWARKTGFNVIAGSESPFIRLMNACRKVPGENHIRVPGEYTLVNPVLTDEMVRFHLKSGAEYTSAKGFPLGMLPPDIFSKKALYKVGGVMDSNEESCSVSTLFKKYSARIKAEEFHAEKKFRKNGLKFSLESRDDGKILENSSEDFNYEVLDPCEQTGWLEKTRERLWKRAREHKYEFRKLTISLTNRCNLRCRMCAIIQSSHKFSLSEKSLKDAIGFGVSEGFNEIEISGGEPLLLDYLPEILAKTEIENTSVKLVTNGLLIKNSTIRMLSEKNIVVQISVDGIGESHDFIRGSAGAYKKTMEVIQKLLANGVRVAVHSVLQKSNVHEIFDLFRLFYKRGLTLHSLALVERMRSVHSEDLDADALSVLDCEFSKIVSFLAGEGCDAQARRYEKLRRQYTRRTEEKGFYMISGAECNVPYRSVIVNPDGSVVPCWHNQWGLMKEGFNVNHRSIRDIVYSRGYRERVFDVKRGKCPGCNTMCYGWDKEFADNIFS